LSSLTIDGAAVTLESSYNLAPATYFLTATDLNGCPLETMVTIEPAEIVTVDLGPDLAVPTGTLVDLTPTASGTIVSYQWTSANTLSCDDCPDIQLVANTPDQIIFSAVNEDGCIDTDTLLITLIPQENESETEEEGYYLPTHFSPGSVGEEALGIGIDLSRISSYRIRIYDRWGNLMADEGGEATQSELLIWEGTRDGRPVSAGVYVYMAEFLYLDGVEEVKGGTITLLR